MTGPNPHDKYGRLIINVKVGEVVAIEEGFMTLKVFSKTKDTATLVFTAPKSVKIERVR